MHTDSYLIRNAAMSTFAEIVVRLLTGEELQERERHTRDRMLQSLLVCAHLPLGATHSITRTQL